MLLTWHKEDTETAAKRGFVEGRISRAVKAGPLSGGCHGALSHRPQVKTNKQSLLRALAPSNSSKAPKIPSRRHGSKVLHKPYEHVHDNMRG